MFPVHASSILHGGLVGAGFTWATITMVFTIFFGDTNGQIHCWKGKGTRRDRGTAVFTIFHSSSDMKSPRLNFTLAYSCCNALQPEMFQCHYRCVPIAKAAWHELQGIHESWSTSSRTAWQKKQNFKVLFLIIPLFDFGWNFEQRRFPNHVWTLDPTVRFVINPHWVMQE